MKSDKECKVVFNDGNQIRSIRGVIEKIDNFFIYIHRRDGNLTLNKSCVLKVENWTSGECDGLD